MRFGQKLSMLEGVAVLTGLTAAAADLAGQHVTAYTDNMGFVWAMRNGKSKDLYTYTVAKAVHDVAEGLGVKLCIRKVKRCSDREADAADALSKCDFSRAFNNLTDKEKDPMGIPRVILQWLKAPAPSASLGRKILAEIQERNPGLVVRDWRAWEDSVGSGQ